MRVNSKLNIVYLAFSESTTAKHAGFVHTYNIVKELANNEVKVTLFINGTLPNESKFRTIDVSALRVKNLLLHPINFLRKFSEIRKELRNYSIIHERFCINPISYFLLLGNNAKYMLEMNDPGIETWRGLRKLLYVPLIKLKTNACDAIIVQTETLKEIISKNVNKPIFVIGNGVNLSDFVFDAKTIKAERKKFVNDDGLLITFVGSFREWHGVLDIPFIAEKVIKKHKNVRFLLVGDGKEFNKTKYLIEKKNLTKYVLLIGAVDHYKIPLLLKASDICIAPFNTRNFPQLQKHGFWWCPVKLLEYLAAEKPIVSYRFREIENIVGEAALLVEQNNSNDFVNGVVTLIDAPSLRHKFSEKSKIIALKNSWKEKVLQILRVYKNLM